MQASLTRDGAGQPILMGDGSTSWKGGVVSPLRTCCGGDGDQQEPVRVGSISLRGQAQAGLPASWLPC